MSRTFKNPILKEINDLLEEATQLCRPVPDSKYADVRRWGDEIRSDDPVPKIVSARDVRRTSAPAKLVNQVMFRTP